MEWEKWYGCVALGVKDGDTKDNEAESFRLELLCEMIKETNTQQEGVEIMKEPPEE